MLSLAAAVVPTSSVNSHSPSLLSRPKRKSRKGKRSKRCETCSASVTLLTQCCGNGVVCVTFENQSNFGTVPHRKHTNHVYRELSVGDKVRYRSEKKNEWRYGTVTKTYQYNNILVTYPPLIQVAYKTNWEGLGGGASLGLPLSSVGLTADLQDAGEGWRVVVTSGGVLQGYDNYTI